MEMSILKRLIVGAPMPLAQARHERLSKTVALAGFSSDAMSSIAYANLRGVRESGRVFAVPTYLFIVTFSVLVGTGLFRWLTGTLPAAAAAHETVAATQPLTWFLVLRAFASGCTALTGVEAISNGVPAFKHPEARNAAITMGWMAAVLGPLFIGLSVLASALGITPMADETVVSQVAPRLFGDGVAYYPVHRSTTLILSLAANSSFAAL